MTDFDACPITWPDVPVSPSDGHTPATRHKGPISTLQRISDKNVSSWMARARKAAPTTSVIQQAQRRQPIPYGEFALERAVAGRGAKLAFNELGAISFTLRGRGDRTAT